MDIGDIMGRFNRVEPEFVGGAVDNPTLDACTIKPNSEAVGVVVTASGHFVGVPGLEARSATKLGAANHQRFLVQTGPFQTQTGPPGHPWNGNGLKTGYSQKTWNGNGQTGPFQPGLRPKS
jgi:hypothetical protein